MEFSQFKFPDDGIVIHYENIYIEVIKLKYSPKDVGDSEYGWNISASYQDVVKQTAEKYEEEVKAWNKLRSKIDRKAKKSKIELLRIDRELCVLHFAYRALVCFLYNLNKDNTHLEARLKDENISFDELNLIESVKLFFEQQRVIRADSFILSIDIIEKSKDVIEIAEIGRGTLKIKLGKDEISSLYINHLNILSELNIMHGQREANGFMDFDWGINLSSGEQAYLNLFSRMHFARKVIKRDIEESKVGSYEKEWPENLIILLDEGELGFHPQWQKQYIKYLIEMLPKIFMQVEEEERSGIFPLKPTNLQIIITTHSPISLSDIPRRHINLFDKEEIERNKVQRTIKYGDKLGINNTFGANIHELFSESFFLQGQLVGDFALMQIKDIVDDLNKEDLSNVRIEQIGQLIPVIGEPLIRDKLQSIYDNQYVTQRMNNAEKLQYFQEQIDKIKGRKSEKN